MCDHHHAARHILCPQCDLLVALPQLEHRQKAACPRCGTTLTTTWDAPRQRPTAYALVALFMLLLANLFPFYLYESGWHQQRNSAAGNSQRAVYRGLRQPRHLLYSLCNWYRPFVWSPFCCWSIGSGCPLGLRRFWRAFCFTSRPGAWRRSFLPACW